MSVTFYAKEPGRYVQIQENFLALSGTRHKIENCVTGYKMVIDLEKSIYDSFITKKGSPVWLPHSTNRKVQNMSDFWHEVAQGHLYEEGHKS